MSYDTRMLDDGVMFESREETLVLALPKKAVPRNPRGVRLNQAKTKANNGVGVYEVPKSDTYVYIKEKLADGSVVQCTRFKPIPRTDREAIYAAAIAKGLKVLPLEEEKESNPDKPKSRISIDDLK